MSRPKSFLTLRKTATQGSATSISVSSVCSEMRAASSVPMAEPMSAHTAAVTAGRSRTLPLRKYFSAATSVPVPLTTLFVPAARWAGIPAIR